MTLPNKEEIIFKTNLNEYIYTKINTDVYRIRNFNTIQYYI